MFLSNPFHSKTFDEKLIIVKNGRPCPQIPRLSTSHKDKNKVYNRHFKIFQYSKTL